MATAFQMQLQKSLEFQKNVDFQETGELKTATMLNAGLFNVIFGIGGKSSTSPGSGGSTVPSLPSGPAVATLIDMIQVVEDGDVIRAEDHNDLVAAVRLIARLLDTGQIAQEIKATAAPLLQTVVGKTAFQVDEGLARGPEGDPTTPFAGWMPLDLPDGYEIHSLHVWGRYPGTAVGDWPLSLRRIEHSGQNETALISGSLTPTATQLGTAFDKGFDFDARGHTVAEADQLWRVDTSKYRYQFHTAVTGANPSADLKLNSVQVTCVKG
jgi:hypothetical protein